MQKVDFLCTALFVGAIHSFSCYAPAVEITCGTSGSNCAAAMERTHQAEEPEFRHVAFESATSRRVKYIEGGTLPARRFDCDLE
jgi:hypothetical protein